MESVLVFGYGSLMDRQSLLATIPEAKNIQPAYVTGFTRDFSLWDDVGWSQTNLDVAGEPFCALDVHTSKDAESIVNGIVFSIPKSSMHHLLKREKDYEVISTAAYNWNTRQLIGECVLFSGNKYNGKYIENSPAQQRYWDICCTAAKEYGDEFYNIFLDTASLEVIV
jgi:cation transport regulator ChaC